MAFSYWRATNPNEICIEDKVASSVTQSMDAVKTLRNDAARRGYRALRKCHMLKSSVTLVLFPARRDLILVTLTSSVEKQSAERASNGITQKKAWNVERVPVLDYITDDWSIFKRRTSASRTLLERIYKLIGYLPRCICLLSGLSLYEYCLEILHFCC